MTGKPKHELMAQQSAEWFNRNLISSDLAAQLARRYGRRTNVFSSLGFWLAVFSAIVLWVTLPSVVSRSFWQLITPEMMLIFPACLIGIAFLLRIRWLLCIGLLLLLYYSSVLFTSYQLYGLRAPQGPQGSQDLQIILRDIRPLYLMSLFQSLSAIAVPAVLITICGLLLRKLENGRLERFSGFGNIFILFGLFFFNFSLFLMSMIPLSPMAFENAQLFAVLLFAAAAIGQIVLGACLKDPIFTGAGIVFLSVNFYTRFFEAFWDRLSHGSFFLVAGLSGMILGYVFELLYRRKLQKSGVEVQP